MLNFINKHTILQLVFALLLLGWTGYTVFTQLSFFPTDGQTLLYQKIAPIWENSTMGCKIVAMLMILLEILFVQRFYSLNKFSDNQTFMPSVMFLAFLNVSGMLTVFTPAWFTVFILTFLLLYNLRDNNEKPVKNRILASGALIALATLLDFHSVWLVFFLICALAANRFSKFKDVLILFAGALLVYVYVFTFHFLRGSMHEWSLSYAHYQFFELIKSIPSLKVLDYVLMGYLLVSTIYVVTLLKLFYDNKLIILRKRFVTIVLLTIASVAMVLFTSLNFRLGLAYLLIPMTLVYSMLSNIKRRKFLHDLLFIALVVLLCL